MAEAILHRLDICAAADEQGGLRMSELVKVESAVSGLPAAFLPIAVRVFLDLLEVA